MSEAAQVPFTETKAPESADRLHRGALSLIDISASTMANIGPAYSFFFGFGFLVFTAGVAAPLTIIVAGIAIAFLGNTLAQFSRAHPSTGGFISFVGKTFGGTSAVTTAILCGAGYIIAISSVLAISGGFLATTLQHYLHWNIPWIILSVILTGGAVLMTIRGVGVSTKLAGFFFGFEMLVLIIVSIAALIKNGGHLSLIPFEPSPHHQGLQRPGCRLPAGDLLLHRLGELGRAGRGDRQPAPQRAAGRVPVRRAHGRQLRAVLLRDRHRLRLQRRQDQQPEHHPVHHPGPGHPRQLRVLRLPGRPHLDARRPDLGDQQPGPADLQRRP